MKKASFIATDGVPDIAAEDQIIGNAVMPHVRRGFTLMELLVVTVTLGVLAAIAIPKFTGARERAFVAAVTSDLKIMASQMEIHQAENMIYAANVALLTDFTGNVGVNIIINEATAGMGWAATANHVGLTGSQCVIYVGNGSAANAVPATSPGIVMCQ